MTIFFCKKVDWVILYIYFVDNYCSFSLIHAHTDNCPFHIYIFLYFSKTVKLISTGLDRKENAQSRPVGIHSVRTASGHQLSNVCMHHTADCALGHLKMVAIDIPWFTSIIIFCTYWTNCGALILSGCRECCFFFLLCCPWGRLSEISVCPWAQSVVWCLETFDTTHTC